MQQTKKYLTFCYNCLSLLKTGLQEIISVKIKTIIIVILLSSIFASNSGASTGIGIMLGDPTGLSLKFNDFPILGIGAGLGRHLHIHCDYWVKNATLSDPFKWYIGIGGKLLIGIGGSNDKRNDDSIGVGIRVPIGLQVFAADNIEIFGEITPGIVLMFGTHFGMDADIDAAIGFRFYL